MVQGIHRPRTHGCRVFNDFAYLYHDRRFGKGSTIVLFLLNDHTETQQLKRRHMSTHGFSHEQLEGSLRSLELISLALSILQRIDQFLQFRMVLGERDPEGLNLFLEAASSGRI